MKIHVFDNSSDFVNLPAGHVLFLEGDKADQMYAILSGSVEIVLKGNVVEVLGPGDIFGEMALVEDRPRSASAIVREAAKIVAVDRNRFLFMVQQTPFFSLQVLSVVAERLRRLMKA